MKVEVYEKPILTRFISVNGVEFEMSDLLCALGDIRRTVVDDHYGDHSLRDYELSCSHKTMIELVKMGLVKNYTGSRMANLFCMKDEEAINKLVDMIYDEDEKFEKLKGE